MTTKFTIIISVVCLTILGLTGCNDVPVFTQAPYVPAPTVVDVIDNVNSKTNNPASVTNAAYALIVGVADGKVGGPCPGSDVDAHTFETICAVSDINATKLINEQATVKRVKAELQQLCETYDTVVFYYSGHGGQTPSINPYAPFEGDGLDEFLCLYDKAMLDNDIWAIISKAKGRVICIFDCCHSETMYRAPMFVDKIEFGAPMFTEFNDANNPGGIFVLAGSPEAAYSYGSATGGQLTNAIKKHFYKKTYAELFELLENDKQLRRYQKPMCTVINGFDINKEFLK